MRKVIKKASTDDNGNIVSHYTGARLAWFGDLIALEFETRRVMDYCCCGCKPGYSRISRLRIYDVSVEETVVTQKKAGVVGEETELKKLIRRVNFNMKSDLKKIVDNYCLNNTIHHFSFESERRLHMFIEHFDFVVDVKRGEVVEILSIKHFKKLKKLYDGWKIECDFENQRIYYAVGMSNLSELKKKKGYILQKQILIQYKEGGVIDFEDEKKWMFVQKENKMVQGNVEIEDLSLYSRPETLSLRSSKSKRNLIQSKGKSPKRIEKQEEDIKKFFEPL